MRGLRPGTAVPLTLGLLAITTPGKAQQSDAIPREICDSVRALVRHEGDSLMAAKPGRWRPDSANHQLIEGMRGAQVVIQIWADTLGKLDIRTFRAVWWKDQVFVRLARQQALNLEPQRYEPFPGCAVAYVVTMPFNFSTSPR